MPQPADKCPFDHGQQVELEEPALQAAAQETSRLAGKCPFGHEQKTNEKQGSSQVESKPSVHNQPAFINPPELAKVGGNGPQMIFTGPVFIGYPMEQALAFMQQYKGTQ